MGQVLCSSVWGLGSRSQNGNGRTGRETKEQEEPVLEVHEPLTLPSTICSHSTLSLSWPRDSLQNRNTPGPSAGLSPGDVGPVERRQEGLERCGSQLVQAQVTQCGKSGSGSPLTCGPHTLPSRDKREGADQKAQVCVPPEKSAWQRNIDALAGQERSEVQLGLS